MVRSRVFTPAPPAPGTGFPGALNPFLLALLAGLLLSTGCSSSRQQNGPTDFQLNLNRPEITERMVAVNGGVVAPVERIQWDWGDGRTDRHHFFPAEHTYDRPGQYLLTVTVFNHKNETASKSLTIEIE